MVKKLDCVQDSNPQHQLLRYIKHVTTLVIIINVFRQIGALYLPFSCSENAYESHPILFVAVHT